MQIVNWDASSIPQTQPAAPVCLVMVEQCGFINCRLIGSLQDVLGQRVGEVGQKLTQIKFLFKKIKINSKPDWKKLSFT